MLVAMVVEAVCRADGRGVGSPASIAEQAPRRQFAVRVDHLLVLHEARASIELRVISYFDADETRTRASRDHDAGSSSHASQFLSYRCRPRSRSGSNRKTGCTGRAKGSVCGAARE